MKKRLITALCSTLAVAAALPALADHQIGGYYRVSGIMENVGIGKDVDPDKVVDHRFRARWQNNINEYINVVWFGEVDTPFGEQSKGAIGNGGKQGADGVNIETKNAYLDLKIPNAPAALALRTGVQGFGDNTLNGVVMNDDMAGIKVDGKMDMVNATFGWFKLSEGPTAGLAGSTARSQEDDVDLWALQLGLEPVKGLKISPELYWFNDQVNKVQETFLGVGAAFKAAPVDLSGWFLMDFGSNDTADTDTQAFAMSVKAAMEVPGVSGAKAAFRLIYFGADDDDKDDLSVNQPSGSNGAFEFYDENLQIFLADADYMNTAGGRRALTDAAYAGYGLLGGVLSGSYTPATMKNVYVKGGLGYFMSLSDERNDEANASREGTVLGTEIALKAGIKVAEKADVSLRGSYAMLGDFYDKKAAGGDDPDDLYKLALMINVPY